MRNEGVKGVRTDTYRLGNYYIDKTEKRIIELFLLSLIPPLETESTKSPKIPKTEKALSSISYAAVRKLRIVNDGKSGLFAICP